MFKFQVSVQNQYIILHKYKFLISIKKRCTACFIYMTSANSGEPTKMERTAVITNHRLSLGLLWLVMATSSIVFIEPTPYDVLGAGLMLVFFGLGLRFPPGLGTAAYLLGIFALANIVASAFAPDPVDSFRSLSVRLYMLVTWIFFTCLIYENPNASACIRCLECSRVCPRDAISWAPLGIGELLPGIETDEDGLTVEV